MGNDERRGQNLEAEDALHGGLLEIVRNQGVAALVVQGDGDAAENGPQVGAGAATGIEDDHVRVRESVGETEFGAQDGVHAFDLVADDLLGGVPDAEFLAQFGIEGVQEGFVEVLDGVPLVEGPEELGAVHAIQGGGGPVEDFDQAQCAETGGIGDLHEEGAEHGNAQEVVGGAPVEAAGDGIRRRGLAEGVGKSGFFIGFGIAPPRPQNPGGEDAVEEGLNERRTKEMLAFLALEAQAEGVFEGLPQAGQGREIGLFDAQARVVGVGGENAGHVLRSGQRRIMEQHTLEILQHAFAMRRRRLTRMGGQTPEFALGLGQRKGFQNARLSGRAFADKGEGAEVGHEHHAVPLPVSLHLLGPGHLADIFSRRFGFDHAARRVLNQEGILFGVRIARLATELIGGEQAAVGQPGAPVGKVDDAADLGGKALPDVREQPFQCRIERSLGHVRPCTPNFSHVGQVTLYQVFGHDSLFHPAHDRLR